jgi:hypothetical protein
MVALMGGRPGLVDQLQAGPYAQPALVPATPWLPADSLGAFKAELSAQRQGDYQLRLLAEPPTAATLRWVIWLRYGTRWELHTSGQTRLELPARSADGDLLNALVVSTLDRTGNESARQGYRVVEKIL